MCEQQMPGTADAVHALLPMVPDPGEKALENLWQQGYLCQMQLGSSQRILGLLRLVQRAG